MVRALDGLAVVVTGSGSGLGASYARFCAANGASVVVNDVDAGLAQGVVDSIRHDGGVAVRHAGDVSSWDEAGLIIDRCVSEFGRIDGLVNNAGVSYYRWPLDQDEESFRKVIEVNLMGTAFCGTHALRYMAAVGSGSIVNVVSGAQMGMAGAGAYGASKGGIAALTYSWAGDMLRHGVRVNAVSPLANTEMAATYAAFIDGPPFPEEVGDPVDVAPLVAYLLSPVANAVTGRILRMNGHEISAVSRPTPIRPGHSQDDWTLQSVAEAVRLIVSEMPH